MWLFSSSAGTKVLWLSITGGSPTVLPQKLHLNGQVYSLSTFTLVPFYAFVVDNVTMTEVTR